MNRSERTLTAVMGRAVVFPTFVVIGAQDPVVPRVCRALRGHPDVLMPEGESEFFSVNYDRGLGAYADIFRGWAGESAVGEASAGYMMLRRAPAIIAARIDGALPGVRLIAVVRDPVKRAFAAFWHHARAGRLGGISEPEQFLEQLSPHSDHLELISGGCYGLALQPYVHRFGSRLLVVDVEDLDSNSEVWFGKVAEHIGITGLDLLIHAYTAADIRRPPSKDERERLYHRFSEDIERLESLLDRSFERWHPGGDT